MSLVSSPFVPSFLASFCTSEQPTKSEDYVDENGVRTTVEYTVNDEGKKVKVCLSNTAHPNRHAQLGCRTDHPQD